MIKNSKRVHRLKLIFLLLLPIACMMTSCKDNSRKPGYTIGFSQCVASDKWRNTMFEEMKRELSFHPETKLIYTDANNSSQLQIEQVKDMLREGIDLLIISPNEAKPLTPVVEEAFNQGIPVIVIDRKTSSTLYTAYVGADNFEIGRMAGEYLAHRLNKKGYIVEVMGLPGSSPAIERQRGFYQAIKKFPEIQITKQVYGDWLIDKAEEAVNKVAEKYKKIDAVFAHNDQMALGAYQALKRNDSSNKIKIVGVDALPNNGLELVINRTFDASMLYPTGGKEAIRTAFSILNKEPFEKENILKTVVIDSTNVQLMKMQADRINSQQTDIERQQTMLKEQQEIYDYQQTVLTVLVVSLVLAVVFGGIAFYSLNENWKNNKRLEAKNEEIMQHQNQLIEMSARAQVATEAKFNFFTNISHEFRTPLTLILIPLEELLADSRLSIQAKSHLQLINKNVIRLLRMVNQLIDFRKIEYDGMKIKASENNLIAFSKEIVETFKEVAVRRNIDLRLVTDERELKVWFDLNMLDKVLFNLLSNAFKFVNDNGSITITIRKEDGHSVEISVADNGVGMTEDTIYHAFDLFYQGESTGTKGSGLGLALSKEIIQLHKGSISVSSKKWKGTTFKILLPLGEDHLTDDEKAYQQMPASISYEDVRIFTTDLQESIPAKSTGDSFAAVKEQSILLIEDNEEMLEFIKQKLSTDYEVFTANNGNTGLNEAFEKVPDLIISDIILPAKSGIDITQILKTDVRTSHIPIILLTAKGSPEQQIEGMQKLADAYLTKPFNVRILIESIKNLINNRNILKEHYTSEFRGEGKLHGSNKLDKKFLNDFAGIVESNLANENFNVEDICKHIGLSRVQVYRKVKALLDCSISDYILNRRLQKAKYMLLNEDLSIGEITYKVGFSSPAYFATVFKSKYGCTPTEFKKKQLA